MRALIASLIVALTLLAGCAVEAPPPLPVARPTLVADPAGLDIPAISVHAAGVADLVLDERGALDIPTDAATVGWFPLGPAPGEPGPAVLTGHVSYNGPGVFARLHELRPGDRVEVPRKDGTIAAFEVYEVGQYSKAAFPTERVYGNRPDPELRLITCGGELDGHTYRDNVVAFARLAT